MQDRYARTVRRADAEGAGLARGLHRGPREGALGDRDPVRARPGDLRDGHLRLRRPGPPPPRARVPERGPPDPDRGPPHRGRARGLPVRWRTPRVRRLPERGERADPPRRALFPAERPREPDRGRGGPAVHAVLRRDPVHLRQQRQHPRGRHPSRGLPFGHHEGDQRLGQEEQPLQEQGPDPPGRGRPRGHDRSHLDQAREPPVRGPDQDAPWQLERPRDRRLARLRLALRVLRGEPVRTARDR